MRHLRQRFQGGVELERSQGKGPPGAEQVHLRCQSEAQMQEVVRVKKLYGAAQGQGP